MFNTGLGQQLLDSGFTQSEVDSILTHTANVVPADSPELVSMYNQQKAEISQSAEALAKAQQSDLILGSMQKDGGKRVVQDNPIPVKLPEQSPVLLGQFAPVLSDATDSMAIDYPDSYGETDDAGNFYRVNKKNGDFQWVHSSGTSIKLNKKGDVSVNIKGSLQLLVNGNRVVNVNGTDALGVVGQLLQMVLGGIELKSGAETKISSAGSLTTVSQNTSIN